MSGNLPDAAIDLADGVLSVSGEALVSDGGAELLQRLLDDWLTEDGEPVDGVPAAPEHAPDSAARCAESPAAEASKPVGASVGIDVNSDGVYRHFVPFMNEVLSGTRRKLGKQKRAMRIASLCGGAGPDKKVWQLFQFDVEYLFSIDKDPVTKMFSDANTIFKSEHWFQEAFDFIEGTSGECMEHKERCDISNIVQCMIDILVVTLSCRPYSINRARRTHGTIQHEDASLMEAWFGLMKRHLPLASLFENVFGFALAEDRDNQTSPLVRMLERVAEELPMYKATVFFSPGNVWLVFVRHRIFVVVVHEAARSTETMQVLVRIVKDVND